MFVIPILVLSLAATSRANHKCGYPWIGWCRLSRASRCHALRLLRASSAEACAVATRLYRWWSIGSGAADRHRRASSYGALWLSSAGRTETRILANTLCTWLSIGGRAIAIPTLHKVDVLAVKRECRESILWKEIENEKWWYRFSEISHLIESLTYHAWSFDQHSVGLQCLSCIPRNSTSILKWST